MKEKTPLLRHFVSLTALHLLFSATSFAVGSTGSTGSVTPAPFDNTQPSVTLRNVLVKDGLFPTSTSSSNLSNGNEGTVGEVRIVAFTVPLAAPDLDGRPLSILENQVLRSILVDTYGSNIDLLQFNIPNLTNRLTLGTTRDASPFQSNGEQRGIAQPVLSPAQLPPHDHVITAPTGSGAQVDNHQPSLSLSYFINGVGEIRAATWRNNVEGWLFADGRTVNRNIYPGLFNSIGYTFGGSGDNFRIPDLRGRVPVGLGTGPDGVTRNLGEVFGSPDLTLTRDSLPPHSHPLPGGGSTQVAGNASPIPNHQPSIALNFGIAFSGSYPGYDSNPWNQNLPVQGEVRIFATPTLPVGFVPANGALYSIAQYSAMFSLLGISYGGDARTVFAVPDLRGRAVLGAGSTLPNGSYSGQAAITLGLSQLPAHSHDLLAGPAALPNPSFEADTYVTAPGYTSNNGGRITGWETTRDVGLNGRTHFPFSNNGTLPQGDQVAFIQSSFGNPSFLSTRIHGLTPNARYTLRFRANMRELYANPASFWSLNSGPFIPFDATPPVGGSNPYHTVTGTFIAGGPTADIQIRNQTSGDSAVLVDAFEMAPASALDSWQVRPWSGDASTNLGASTTHWAACFGAGSSAVINGTTFLPASGQNPAIAGRLSTSGFNTSYTNLPAFPSQPDSGSHTLSEDAIGSDMANFTLLGLNPGDDYTVSFFFSTPTGASGVTLSTRRTSTSFNTGENGLQQGMRIDHHFTASGTMEVFTLTTHTGSLPFALNGIALCRPKPELVLLDELGQPTQTNPLAFGTLPYGTPSAPLFIRLQNIGSVPLNLWSASIGGTAPSAFTFPGDAVGTGINPGTTYLLPVHYLANQLGSAEAILSLSLNDPDNPELTFQLSGATLHNRANWTLLRFGTNASNPTLAGPDRDPEGDGLVNLLEYATNSDPLAPDAPILQLTRSGNATDLSLRINLSATDLTFRLQRSTDLALWTNILVLGPNDEYVAPELTIDTAAETSNLLLRDTTPLGPLYWRLKIEEVIP